MPDPTIIDALAVADEHLAWCRSRGETPADVLHAIGITALAATWTDAFRFVAIAAARLNRATPEGEPAMPPEAAATHQPYLPPHLEKRRDELELQIHALNEQRRQINVIGRRVSEALNLLWDAGLRPETAWTANGVTISLAIDVPADGGAADDPDFAEIEPEPMPEPEPEERAAEAAAVDKPKQVAEPTPAPKQLHPSTTARKAPADAQTLADLERDLAIVEGLGRGDSSISVAEKLKCSKEDVIARFRVLMSGAARPTMQQQAHVLQTIRDKIRLKRHQIAA